jgi:hypothetical protein
MFRDSLTDSAVKSASFLGTSASGKIISVSKPDSVRAAYKSDTSRVSAYTTRADTSRASHFADSSKNTHKADTAVKAHYADSAFASHKADTAVKSYFSDSTTNAHKADTAIKSQRSVFSDSSKNTHKADTAVKAHYADSAFASHKADTAVKSYFSDSTTNAHKADTAIKSQRSVFSDSSKNTHKADTSKVCHYCDTAAKSSAAVSGTTNYLAKFTGANTVGNSSIYDNGNIGIGKTVPIFPLDISDGNLKTYNTEVDVLNLTTSEAYASNPFMLTFGILGEPTNATRIAFIQTGNYGQDRLGHLCLQLYGGNVGICTAVPDSTLSVNGSAHISGNVRIDGSYPCHVLPLLTAPSGALAQYAGSTNVGPSNNWRLIGSYLITAGHASLIDTGSSWFTLYSNTDTFTVKGFGSGYYFKQDYSGNHFSGPMTQTGGDVVLSGSDIHTDTWQNWSGSYSPVGWASISTAEVYYVRVGRRVDVHFFISGITNSILCGMTLPYANQSNMRETGIINRFDNGTYSFGSYGIPASSNTVSFYVSAYGSMGTWAGGTTMKQVSGTLTYYTDY